MTDRLHRSAPPAGLPQPVSPTDVGVVHLGIGAFHRAHQAVFTDRAMALSGDLRWGILGVTQRSAGVRDQLRPQDGVYAVLTAGAAGGGSSSGDGSAALGDGLSLELVGAVVDVAYPAEETPRVLAALAAPTTHVVTLTITEKGYARRPDGGLDVDRVRPDLEALRAEELAVGSDENNPEQATATSSEQKVVLGAAEPGAASSAIGILVRGLAVRRRVSGDLPLTVLTCDNMVDNGRVLERLVREAVDAALPGAEGAALRAYLDAAVTFPCSMVDRIVPATTPAQRDAVEAALGVRDEGLVVGEPFTQWVIEDRFAGPRPPWEAAGATLTADVAPYEQAKLRLLNGTHSLVAYSGWLAGHATIAEAVGDPAIAEAAREYLFDDALPTLDAPFDLRSYGEEILHRFANPHTGHTTIQVAMDGTQKIPFRWGGVLGDSLSAGRVPGGLVLGLAAWAEFVRRRVMAGEVVDDPRAAELAEVVHGAGGDREATVRGLLGVPGLLPDVAVGHEALLGAVVDARVPVS
ncbi:mannitol dehydrogenase family protein [Antribacter gilvus]|uniref:mannitol dehydrogenase family protein n=1 Tax=Antribacter gilvus TaxID=2304675 RepID=UPI000F797F95|nr:mannitol dehydrogenase family protein [Antribacter gilvus]